MVPAAAAAAQLVEQSTGDPELEGSNLAIE